jgi:pantothenate kinase
MVKGKSEICSRAYCSVNAQSIISSTAQSLTTDGFNAEHLLRGNGGAGKAQLTMSSTAQLLTADGFSANNRILSRAGGYGNGFGLSSSSFIRS